MDALDGESRSVKESLRVASKSFKDLGLPPPSSKDKATVEKAYKQIKEDLARAMQTWQGALGKERSNAARVAMQTKQQHIFAAVEKFIGELNDKDQPKEALKARIQKDDGRIQSELEKLRKDIQSAVDTAREAGLDVSVEAAQMMSQIEQKITVTQNARKDALKQLTGEVLDRSVVSEGAKAKLDAPPSDEKKSPRSSALAKEVLARDSSSGKVVSPRTKAALADSLGSMSRASGSANRLNLSPRNAADKARVKDLFSEAVEKKNTRASAGTLTEGSSSSAKSSAESEPKDVTKLDEKPNVDANVKVDDVPGVAIDAFTEPVIKKIVQSGYKMPLKGLSTPVAIRMIKELSLNVQSSAASRSDLENEGLLHLCHEKFMTAIQKLSLPNTDPAHVEFKLAAVENSLSLCALISKMDIIIFKGSALFPLLDAGFGVLQSLQGVVAPNLLTEKAKVIEGWRKKTIKMDAGTSARMRQAFVQQVDDLKKLQSAMDAIERQIAHLERTT